MLYFVRHGSTPWNEHLNEKGEREPMFQGQTDIPLSETGISQAFMARENLKNCHFDRVISSPLSRALKTCEIICDGKYKIELDDRLMERHMGEYQGKTAKDFPILQIFNRSSDDKFTSGEKMADVEKRVFEFLDELSKEPDKDVLIVSHGGVGCVLESYFHGMPEDGNYGVFHFKNCEPKVFDFNEITNKK